MMDEVMGSLDVSFGPKATMADRPLLAQSGRSQNERLWNAQGTYLGIASS